MNCCTVVSQSLVLIAINRGIMPHSPVLQYVSSEITSVTLHSQYCDRMTCVIGREWKSCSYSSKHAHTQVPPTHVKTCAQSCTVIRPPRHILLYTHAAQGFLLVCSGRVQTLREGRLTDIGFLSCVPYQ